jgi:hypothetical protein
LLGLLLIAAAAASALLLAAAARLPGVTATLVVGYVAYVGNLGLVTLVLSPVHAVTRGWIALAETVILAGAVGIWWRRGCHVPSPVGARAAAREIVTDPVTAAYFLFVLVLLAYQGLLATSPPNNMDSVSYHLARAAAWAQSGSFHWIHNAPDVRLTAFQPFDEQQQLFLFAVTGGGRLYALPQFLAEVAILVSVYGAARRLGFAVRAAACSAFLLATFSSVALEAFTAQNDLFAASLAAAAAFLLLGGGPVEQAVAGAAVAFGLGTKLTFGLIVPTLAWLAFARGRRVFLTALAGGVAGFVAVGMWGYVLNLSNTGHVLGTGTGVIEVRASPSYPGSVATGFDLLYGLMDGSVLSSRLIHALAIAGAVVALAAAMWYRDTVGRVLAVAAPFLAPIAVIGASGAIAWLAGDWGFPIRGPNGVATEQSSILNLEYTRLANENYSAWGPVGIVAVLVAIGLAVHAYRRRTAGSRELALATALPVFLVLVSLSTRWVPFTIRFFLLPAVLAAPLLARLFAGRLATAAWAVVSALAVTLTIVHDQPKPLNSPNGYGRPWNYTWADAFRANSYNYVAAALDDYEKLVPPHACVGAILDRSEATYVLFGRKLQHRVVFLSVNDAVGPAYRGGLFNVVISTGPNRWVADSFKTAGWTIRPLGNPASPYWLLATDPRGRNRDCGA